jgi:phosphate acetyltransferase
MAISPATASVQTHAKYDRLIADARQVPPAITVVVHPCDETSLRGASEAAEAGIIVPVLVGPKAKISDAARRERRRQRIKGRKGYRILLNSCTSDCK